MAWHFLCPGGVAGAAGAGGSAGPWMNTPPLSCSLLHATILYRVNLRFPDTQFCRLAGSDRQGKENRRDGGSRKCSN